MLIAEIPGEAPTTKRSCSTGTWTSNRRCSAGGRTSGRGSRCATATGSTARGADDGYSTFAALDRHRGGSAGRRRSRPLHRADRGLGGEREPRSARLRGPPRPGSATSAWSWPRPFCNTYDRLWATTSLRGLPTSRCGWPCWRRSTRGASGMLPSTFRIARELLERVEESATGLIVLDDLHVEVLPERIDEGHDAARVLGERLLDESPLLPACVPFSTIRPTSSSPAPGTRPLRSSEPTIPGDRRRRERASGRDALKPPSPSAHLRGRARSPSGRPNLSEDPPYGAHVEESPRGDGRRVGAAPPTEPPWLAGAVTAASERLVRRPAGAMGVGGTIPFMTMLGDASPTPSSSWSACSGPAPTPTVPTSSCTCPRGCGSRPLSPRCSSPRRARSG